MKQLPFSDWLSMVAEVVEVVKINSVCICKWHFNLFMYTKHFQVDSRSDLAHVASLCQSIEPHRQLKECLPKTDHASDR